MTGGNIFRLFLCSECVKKISATGQPQNKNQTEGKANVVAAGWGTELNAAL